MKKILALVLSLLMVVSLFAACGEAPSAGDNTNKEIPDEMTSADGKYEIAFVTDVGQLKDQSFNQGTWEGVKKYASEKGKSYKYYQPENGNDATDDDRYNAMKLACDNGAKVVVAAGFMQAAALEKAAKEFTGVRFIFIDGWDLGLANVTGISFQEEQCGYLAGFAAVMDGYTKLGFTGGGDGANAACNRYGYGFVQGAEAAAAAKGVKVEINYSWLYGGAFSASTELQTLAAGWYAAGTEVIFACGGSMFQSVAAAAEAADGNVIGVDVDQSGHATAGIVITSALKGIGEAAYQALVAAETDATWTAWGTSKVLGAKDNAVGLPTATWSLTGWTVAEYEALLAKIVSGEVVIDGADVPKPASTANVTVTIVE